jgi:hypothetical protein
MDAVTTRSLAQEYRDLLRNGETEADAAEIVDAMMTVGEYVQGKRIRYERRIQAEKHDRRVRVA